MRSVLLLLFASLCAVQVTKSFGADFTNLTEIIFPIGQESLPLDEKQKILELVSRVRAKGTIKSIKLITWADKDFLPNQKKRLTSDQLLLVERRNDHIESLIEKLLDHVRVNKISMAEPEGVMESILSADDVKLKKKFELARDKTSKSIVVIEL